ncbi:tyrosine-protein phosphatase rlph2 [Anaeramoeba ignava]|uniref:Tyrosine-protein phosphatase rlph2 n=1 Tax=Anaeramoeba ignava TaxID=1746090 RepID=A0A9Q0LDF2_ANAIG|nr:tyrosine-protein phosphatase rlph2 [Anaeramoeba ignava]
MEKKHHLEKEKREKIKKRRMKTQISGRVIAIGDVHSYINGLKKLFEMLEENIENFDDVWVVFLGDYVDRGPNPKETLDFLINLWENRPKTTFICGNHDLALMTFLKLIPEPENVDFDKIVDDYKRPWQLYSGENKEKMHLQGRRYPLIYSSLPTFDGLGAEFPKQPSLSSKFSQKYRDFYINLPWIVEHPDYVFIHSGIPNDNRSWDEHIECLRKKDLSDPRPTWICDRNHLTAPEFAQKTIVSGHVEQPEVIFKQKRILVDTTGGENENISAVLLPDNKVFCVKDYKKKD